MKAQSASTYVVAVSHASHTGGVQLRYSYRVYPAPCQREALARAFGCARVVFNDALAARQAARVAGEAYLSDADMSARLTASKETPERAWLAGVSAVVLQQALADLNTAYRNFFASVTGKRQGPKAAPPRFRSRKDSRQSVRFTANARFNVLENGRLRLPKVGDVEVRWSRPLLGLGHFAVMDDGTKISAPRFLRPKPLSVREWQCAACGAVHDRDVNAARNIAALGRREAQNARRGQVRPPLAVAQAGEAGSRRGAA